jgi:hypothetical protein
MLRDINMQPADDGFRRDDDKGLFPGRPDPPSNHPAELIEEAEARAKMSMFQHSELLPEHEILQNKIPTAMEEAHQGSDPGERQAAYGKELYQLNDWKYCCKL